MARYDINYLSKKHLSFKGGHNRTKGKIFLVLFHAEKEYHRTKHFRGLTALEISREVGVPVARVRANMPKWSEWKYLNRHLGVSGNNGKPCYQFVLGIKGQQWLLYLLRKVAPEKEQELLAELKAVPGRTLTYEN